MDGASYLKKIDLKIYHNYAQLSKDLDKMFSHFTLGWFVSLGSVFSHGQLFVIVSRVKNKKTLKVIFCCQDDNYTNSTTDVVYKEVLCVLLIIFPFINMYYKAFILYFNNN